ncbi:MAG: ATP-binding protein, partial [Geminicoccaceae bacterium]
VGRTAHDLLQRDGEALYLGPDELPVDGHERRDREIEMKLADGKVHTLLTTRFPVRAGDGGLIGVGTIATDICKRRQAEEHLRQAQKVEALGRLTGGVAHDFNNLLAVIGGNLSLIADAVDGDAEVKELIDDAQAANRAGADLTHRLLVFGRQQALHPQPTDLGELLQPFSRVLERALGEAVGIELAFDDDLWPVQVDRGHLETSILNLALNGRDAMPEGGRLLISASNRSESEGDVVEIAVSDDGLGMTSEILAQAVQPFFTTKGPEEGSGLGLSMVYGFAEQSGGRFDLQSEPGHGTTARLYLPRHLADREEPATPPHRDGLRQGPSDASILLVEDQDAVRRLARRILRREGYRISEAGDAETALRMLTDGRRIDLLLTDIVLPGGKSGIELARQARAERPGIKLLYASGYASDLASAASVEALDAPLLRKPFQPDELLHLVRQVIDQDRA